MRERDRGVAIHLSWGLGWGRFDSPHGRACFHTGHDTGWQNYTVTYRDAGVGIVMLSNSTRSSGTRVDGSSAWS